MGRRYLSIYFPRLRTDWLARRQPSFRDKAFVMAVPAKGKMVVAAASAKAATSGIHEGMPLADAKALLPGLQVFKDPPPAPEHLLRILAVYCMRYTPVLAPEPPEGLLLDSSGCAHLWGGEQAYLNTILGDLEACGFEVRGAMADTIGAAWALARFGEGRQVIEKGGQATALLPLPPAGLRLETGIRERLHKLGFYRIGRFIHLPSSVLRRRFGEELVLRLRQALGQEEEFIRPLACSESYQEQLACMEPVPTAAGIGEALRRLLESLCQRLEKEGKGLRQAVFSAQRVDGKCMRINIATSRACRQAEHLFDLFRIRIPSIEPGLGIELFTLEAPQVEDVSAEQEALWTGASGMKRGALAGLLDRLANRTGADRIRRYLPREHFWPERSLRACSSLEEEAETAWPADKVRPVRLLPKPEPVEASAPVPDYPPIVFRYKGKLHLVKKADGPERIEPEWWLEEGLPRDYYRVEDEEGRRYWLFRAGHYSGASSPKWFIHGFFA